MSSGVKKASKSLLKKVEQNPLLKKVEQIAFTPFHISNAE